MNFESIAKIVLGSGLFAFLIAEIISFIRKYRLKRRLIKEISFELFANELFTELAIEDYQKLQKNPLEIMPHYRFYTQVISAVLSSGYFINLNFNLVQLIIQFNERFKNIQIELEGTFELTNDEKKRNAFLLPKKEENAKLLLEHLRKSKIFKKLKKKYYPTWNRIRKKEFEERHNVKIKIRKE